MKKLKQRIIDAFNNYFGAKSFEAAVKKAAKINQETGKKMFVVLVGGDFAAISKQDFKRVWKSNPNMKIKKIDRWEKGLYEFKRNSKSNNTSSN